MATTLPSKLNIAVLAGEGNVVDWIIRTFAGIDLIDAGTVCD